MGLSYKARKRWSLVILVIGLPVYIGVALYVVSLFDRPAPWVELAVYIGLGVVWALPFRFVFLGVGQPDPDQPAPRSAPPRSAPHQPALHQPDPHQPARPDGDQDR